MKKIFAISVLLGCVSYLVMSLPQAKAEEANKLFDELKNELQNKGMALKEIKKVERPIKEMLDRGATKDGLKNVLLDLSGNGVKGKDLKNLVDAMNDLMKIGEGPKEVGNIVSQAAHQALAQGLRGTVLAAKVHTAIRQRKMEREKLKKKMEVQEKQMKGKAKKMEKAYEKKVKKQQMKRGMGPMREQGRKGR